METGDAPTEVDTKTILMIQANLQRSKVATAELLQLATEKGISIALVQEPYVGNQGILKQNPGTKVIQCTVGRQKPVKAAIIVFGDKVENEKGLQKSGNRKSDHSWRHKCVEPPGEAREKTGGAKLTEIFGRNGLPHPQHRKHSHLRDL
ncbi:hypothetical protein EVAR_85948_1 [Eumeta japonica]|uniref:Uncharacterized protein n=1 Tax=Eumeta variegata TaxID=151549 RepID=A0A4C1UKE6_EUMVA|nr:hypothetical protein EVAR_85948_1 [Eumeta japonica]